MAENKPTATIWIRDEINVSLLDLKSKHYTKLYNDFAIKDKNCFFKPNYKLGRWDGFYRFVSQTGQTYVYFIDQIVPRLIKWGYDVKVKDSRTAEFVEMQPIKEDIFGHVTNEYGDPYLLRWYQCEAVNAVVENGGGIMIAGTGAGKTIMSASITHIYGQKGLRCITIVPSTTLVQQSSDDFKRWGLDAGQYCGDVKELGATHLVTTWQSLQNVPHILKDFDVLIVDECHGAKANVLANLLKEHGSHIAYRFGMTGTMPKDEYERIRVLLSLGSICYEITAAMLIEEGFLSTIDINILQLMEDIDDGYFPDYSSETAYLRGNKERIQWIANLAEKISSGENGNTLILVGSIPFGKKLAAAIGAHFVYGADKTATRKEAYDLFKTEDNCVVVTTVQVAGTGLSIDRIFNLFLIDLGKSFIRTIQAVGRGLRKNEKAGKTHCEIYDICSNLKYSKQHLRKRVKFYKESSYPYKKTQVKNYAESVDSED